MAEETKEPKTIWTPFGGFKRGLGLISLVVLVASGAGVLPLTEALQQMFTTLALGAVGGNVIGHKIKGN